MFPNFKFKRLPMLGIVQWCRFLRLMQKRTVLLMHVSIWQGSSNFKKTGWWHAYKGSFRVASVKAKRKPATNWMTDSCYFKRRVNATWAATRSPPVGNVPSQLGRPRWACINCSWSLKLSFRLGSLVFVWSIFMGLPAKNFSQLHWTSLHFVDFFLI